MLTNFLSRFNRFKGNVKGEKGAFDSILPELCTVQGCDKKCGKEAHATIIRKNRCDCGGGLAPLIQEGEDKWDEVSFVCESCGKTKEL